MDVPTKIIERAEFEKRGKNLVFRQGSKQILVLEVGDQIYALDNRCPHEGYPLSQGGTDSKSCLLTCNWHNWKFDLKTGECTTGGDRVRTYPVDVQGETLRVDLSDPTPEQTRQKLAGDLKIAFRERDYGRISREVARWALHGFDPLELLGKAILWSHQKLEWGSTHAFAASADWVALYGQHDEWKEKIICLTETIDYMALDALRHADYPFASPAQNYDEDELLAAIENEDVARAEALVGAAFEGGMKFGDLSKAFAKAALEHYNDFGHSLIYTVKSEELCRYLSALPDAVQIERALSLSLARSLCYATREDLVPEFKTHAKTLKALESSGAGQKDWDGGELERMNVAQTGTWLENHYSKYSEASLYRALLKANGMNFLRYDLGYQAATEVGVSSTASWLSFTHALTFSNAVRRVCERFPELWPSGLVQMGHFYGRNTAYIDSSIQMEDWRVESPAGFRAQTIEQLLDHGLAVPIFSAHLLKTSLAIFEEAGQTSEEVGQVLYAALNRFLQSPLKQRHPRRMAFQSLQLVSKDFQ